MDSDYYAKIIADPDCLFDNEFELRNIIFEGVKLPPSYYHKIMEHYLVKPSIDALRCSPNLYSSVIAIANTWYPDLTEDYIKRYMERIFQGGFCHMFPTLSPGKSTCKRIVELLLSFHYKEAVYLMEHGLKDRFDLGMVNVYTCPVKILELGLPDLLSKDNEYFVAHDRVYGKLPDDVEQCLDEEIEIQTALVLIKYGYQFDNNIWVFTDCSQRYLFNSKLNLTLPLYNAFGQYLTPNVKVKCDKLIELILRAKCQNRIHLDSRSETVEYIRSHIH